MCRGCCRALSAAAARLRAAGVRGGAPRGGGWARRPTRNERARTQATGDRRPRPITVYAGQLRGRRAPPPDDKQGRRASQTSHNLGFAGEGRQSAPEAGKLRLDATSQQPKLCGMQVSPPAHERGTGGGYRGPPGSTDARGRVERDTRGRAGPLAAEDAPAGRQDPGLSVWVAPGGASNRTGRQQI